MVYSYLSLKDLSRDEILHVISQGIYVKKFPNKFKSKLLSKNIALLFTQPSTRTRISFEIGINQLGGNAISLDVKNMQMYRGESISDTARILSGYVDAIVMRSRSHNEILQMDKYASVPVINALSDHNHPCQIIASLMTIQEHKAQFPSDMQISWLGDCNNVTLSFAIAASKLGFILNVSCPDYTNDIKKLSEDHKNIILIQDPNAGVKNSDVVITDSWVSMHHKEDKPDISKFSQYQVNDKIMQLAKHDALFTHCLPAHRGQEVTDAILDGSRSMAFEEAINKMHANKAILLYCLGID